jgi:hypothetical protein
VSRKRSKTRIGNPSGDIVYYRKQKHHKKKLNFTFHLTDQMTKLSTTAHPQWKNVRQNSRATPAAGLEIAENATTLRFASKTTMAIHKLSYPLRARMCLVAHH